jgi:2-polyprenyl-6-methoxyphenol hydroxylase-like FAD-dependent oxidoreductase
VHLHSILARGMEYLEGLFPELRREMVDDGAVRVDSGTELGWLGPFGWTAPFARGKLESVWATRDFIDGHLRRRLRQDPRIEWIDRTRVEALVLDRSGRRVCGVRRSDGEVLEATLVVDATGRASRLPEWLRAAGFAVPAETEVDAHTVYTSAFARLARPLPNGWKGLLVQRSAPHVLRGGAIGPIEGGRVLISLATAGGEKAPNGTADFVAFGRRLRAPFFGDALEGAEWLSPARSTRCTTNRWRHYEGASLPAGLLALGDALCAFNPVFGQGISVASMQADALSRVLRARGPDDPRLSAIAMRAVARQVRFPWTVATSQDLRIPGATGRLSPASAALDRYLDRLFALGTRDPEVSLMVSRVFNLVESPLALYAPRTAWRVLREPAHRPMLGPVAPPDLRCAS